MRINQTNRCYPADISEVIPPIDVIHQVVPSAGADEGHLNSKMTNFVENSLILSSTT